MSRKVKLTDSFAKNAELPPGKSDTVFWDTELTGFGLRVRPKSRTWIVYYRPVGYGRAMNSTRYKLGSVQVLTANEARRQAKVLLGQVAGGKHPAAERAELKRQQKAKLKVALDAYDEHLHDRGYVNRVTAMSTLRRNFRAHMNKDVRDLTAAEILAIPAAYQSKRPGAAADFISKAKAFFVWCRSARGLIATNPLANYRKVRSTRKEKIQQAEYGRKLDDDEIVAVWLAASRDHPFDRLVRFALLTGCRRNEAALFNRRWLKDGRYVIPAIVTKSGREHNLPETPALRRFLNECPATPGSDLFFPSAKTGQRMSGWTSQVKALNERSGVEFTLHDLRRTFRSGLSALGVSSDIAEICINHARGTLEAVYNRHDAFAEMYAAFDKWGFRIEQLIDRALNPDIAAYLDDQDAKNEYLHEIGETQRMMKVSGL